MNNNKKIFILLIISIILILSCSNGLKYDGKLRWTAININSKQQQGDAHLISKNNKYVLIDAGHISYAKTKLLPYLRGNQVDHLDAVFISHPHIDHYGGVKILFENNIKINKLYMNLPTKMQMQKEWWGGKYQDLIDIQNLAKKQGTQVLSIKQGDKFIFDNSSYIEILYIYDGINTPVGETDINDMSAIMMIHDGDNKFLLTGDLNSQLGEYLATHANNIQADILKSPHHGTEGFAPNSFFEKVSPNVLVVPSPKDLWCSERSKRSRELSKKYHYQTFINGFHGDITIISYDNKYEVLTQFEPKVICKGIK